MAFRRQLNRSVRLSSSNPYNSRTSAKNSKALHVNSVNVFCGNLSYEVTSDILKRHMSQVGRVVSCEIMTNRDGRPKGSALVQFSTKNAAARAISELHDSDLLGRLLLVREDREVESAVSAPRTSLDERQIPPDVDSRKVYVGNLDYSTSWQDLKDHMRSAGDVIRAEVAEGPDGRSKGYGLVEFASSVGARSAIASLHETQLGGRVILVRHDRDDGGSGGDRGRGGQNVPVLLDRWVPGRDTRDTTRGAVRERSVVSGNSGDLESCRVYVGNLSWEVSWQDLKDHMRSAGDVVRANVLTLPDSNRSKGCGIVEYQDLASAQNAIETLNDTVLKGRPIFVREDREEKKFFS